MTTYQCDEDPWVVFFVRCLEGMEIARLRCEDRMAAQNATGTTLNGTGQQTDEIGD